MTSSGRRTASVTTASMPGSAATTAWRRPARRSAARGVGLVLDFVPNHVAPDHPWAIEHPEYFVRGTADDLARDPDGFLAVGDAVIARGRDPYFPAWPEVLQLDTSQASTRAAAVEVVTSIAARCDGVRCDMAMLMLDDVFDRTWGERAGGGPTPDGGRGYWPTVIGCRQGQPSGADVLGRGVLGPRAGTRRAGLRRLLRQAALRPPRPSGAGRLDPRPHRRGSVVAGAHRAVHGEPRRAAPRRDAPAARGPGGDRDGIDAARRGPAPRGAGRRSPGAGARHARPASGRAARRRAASVVRPAARRPRRRDAARHMGDGRRRRLARQPLMPNNWPRGRGRRPTAATSSSSTSPRRGPTAEPACLRSLRARWP